MQTDLKNKTAANILIVDDKESNIVSLETILKQPDVNIIKALSGEEALGQLLEHEIALILLDVQMPGMDGFETADLIRGNLDTRSIPIIFITAINKEKENIFKGYETGAVDLLFKPIDKMILKSKVSVFLNLYHQRKTIESQNTRLDDANKRILDQQRALIEEERLKVVLQMSGAAAHELNQPLMMLLGNLELLEMDNFEPESVKTMTPKIKKSALRLSETVKKIQKLDQYHTKSHDSTTDILDIDNAIQILYVEDNDNDYQLIKLLLDKNKNIRLRRGKTIARALQILAKETIDIILLEFSLPDGTGLDLLKEMNRKQYRTPVITITSQGSETIATNLLRNGAYDYLPKSGLEPETVISTIKSALEKSRLKRDIHKAIEKMAALSTHDELTGLYNRRYMNEVLEQEFDRAQRYKSNLTCILFDLDFFKPVNDNFGHDCGDYVLTEFAARIIDNKRKSDLAFRYGGEEFLLLLPETDALGARFAAEALRKVCQSDPYHFDSHSFIVTVSMGIADIDGCLPQKARDLISFADKALYRAKAEGRNCTRIFQRENDECLPSEMISASKGLFYFKEQISSILAKTKTSAMNSIELLIMEAGGNNLQEETQRNKAYITLFCKKLRLPDSIVQPIKQAASIHNCFKLLLGDELLLKKEDLSDDDKQKIEYLPYLQVEMANQFEFFSEEKTVLLHNHEWHNGSGYPEGLSDDEISIGAKIFSITNALVAMTSDRPFRKKLSHDQALLEIAKNAGTQFDPSLVISFMHTIIENNLLDISRQKVEAAINKIEKGDVHEQK